MRAKAIVVAVVVICAVVTTWSGIHLERTVGNEHRSKSLLLLPNGKHLKVASLGQAPLLALCVILGIAPWFLLDWMYPSVERLVQTLGG